MQKLLVVTLFAIILVFGYSSVSYAATSDEMIVGTSPEHRYTPEDDGKNGRTSIKLLSPKSRASFNRDIDNPVLVRWRAKNVHEDSVVIVELENLVLNSGWNVGGGVWQGEIAGGDSTGEYRWKVNGVGLAGAGVYRVRTLIRACHPDGCEYNPDYPRKGSVKVKTYAKTPWKTIKITSQKG